MSQRRHKITVLFIIFDLGAGGAERVLLNIMKQLDRQQYEPVLYLFSKKGSLVPKVPEDVKIVSFEDTPAPRIYGLGYCLFFMRIRAAVKMIRPHVVLSFMWYPNAIALIVKKLLWNRIKVIVSERTSTSIYSSKMDDSCRSAIMKFLYPSAELVIAPSHGIADDLVGHSVKGEKVRVIHNPVDIDLIRERAHEPLDHPWYDGRTRVITAVGRLGNEKGFDHLIRAMSLLRNETVDCKLVIVGEGSERKTLENLIKDLQLEDRVALVGFQENPYKYVARSTVFTLSSLYEGFPNVLLEAITLGIPSVATRCPTGPDEILTDGVNGLLVRPGDAAALAAALKRLLQDEVLRRRLGEESKKRAVSFDVRHIVKEYEQAIEAVLEERKD